MRDDDPDDVQSISVSHNVNLTNIVILDDKMESIHFFVDDTELQRIIAPSALEGKIRMYRHREDGKPYRLDEKEREVIVPKDGYILPIWTIGEESGKVDIYWFGGTLQSASTVHSMHWRDLRRSEVDGLSYSSSFQRIEDRQPNRFFRLKSQE